MTRRAATWVLLGAYGLWNLAVWWATEPQETWDTYRYLGGAVFDVQNPGILTTALFTLIQDRRGITLTLVVIAVIAWALLALQVLRALRWRWTGWFLAILVLLLSMTPSLWSWNMLFNTESLAVSTAVLWLATLIGLAHASRHRVPAALALALALGGVSLARPQLLIAIAPATFVALIWWGRRAHAPGIAWGAIATTLPFIAFAMFRIWQLSEVAVYQYRYALNNLVDKTPSFRAYALERMPPCDAIPNALNGPAPWNDIHALESTLMNVCPETWLWFRGDEARMPAWILAKPLETAENFIAVMPSVTLPVIPDVSPMPASIGDALLNPHLPWIWALFALAIGVAVAVAARVRIRITWRAITGWLVILGGCLAYLVAVWGADGYDIERHVFPFIPLAAVAGLLLPATLPRTAQLAPSSEGRGAS